MQLCSFHVFGQDTARPTLRCFDAQDHRVGERPLKPADIDAFAEEVEQGYRAATPNLVAIGRRLYDWLDGPTERWLAAALQANPDGLALHIDVAARLRHLPWELLCADGAFLCANPLRMVLDATRDQPIELVVEESGSLGPAGRCPAGRRPAESW